MLYLIGPIAAKADNGCGVRTNLRKIALPASSLDGVTQSTEAANGDTHTGVTPTVASAAGKFIPSRRRDLATTHQMAACSDQPPEKSPPSIKPTEFARPVTIFTRRKMQTAMNSSERAHRASRATHRYRTQRRPTGRNYDKEEGGMRPYKDYQKLGADKRKMDKGVTANLPIEGD